MTRDVKGEQKRRRCEGLDPVTAKKCRRFTSPGGDPLLCRVCVEGASAERVEAAMIEIEALYPDAADPCAAILEDIARGTSVVRSIESRHVAAGNGPDPSLWPHRDSDEYHRQRTHLVRTASLAIAADVKLRRQALDEAEAAAIITGIRSALTELELPDTAAAVMSRNILEAAGVELDIGDQ